MTQVITLRRAGPRDADAVSALLEACYSELYRGWYPDEAVTRAAPALARAPHALLASGRYRIAEIDGRPAAAGGWSLRPGAREGHLRLFGTHPRHLRRGAAGAILQDCLEEARREGVKRMDCVSSLPAEPFYSAHGFATRDFALTPAPGGAMFGVAMMSRPL
ncbi:MAG: GNAT family N-acetyltransferase [Pseudomonadota bacterium]